VYNDGYVKLLLTLKGCHNNFWDVEGGVGLVAAVCAACTLTITSMLAAMLWRRVSDFMCRQLLLRTSNNTEAFVKRWFLVHALLISAQNR